MHEQEQLYTIALTHLKGLGVIRARGLLDAAGSATDVFAHHRDIRAIVPDASEQMQRVLADTSEAMRMAERELEAARERNIQVMTLLDDCYPHRLLECCDAPLALYHCGMTDMNRRHVLSMIGTRKCSDYGREVCNRFVAELRQLVPDVLVVSGLAYGIDIHSHMAALDNGLDTVAVLAHGLDIIYPYQHRQTAADIVHRGGALLTEYAVHTTPERQNFVHRNRIVAGMCDACIVVESAAKGGSLITARLALDYSRDVYAFPGRANDYASEGCNRLIMRHEASLISSAEDFVTAMGWNITHDSPHTAKQSQQAVQQDLFATLSPEEYTVVQVLTEHDSMHINQVSAMAGIPFSALSALLFSMEMKGVVKALGGSRYRLAR